ncbi:MULTISPECIES: alpha/beta fold hydrolase [Burkholderiaceae]|uniref:alpha/beta fold hydrolase n=1 Tax=Burkholderiaceae TaxID=119060 RepID=UPI00142343B1|nr:MULTISPECIES: alpha/beta fold hydrolase [Burkholderiaceae]MBN3846577.1 alpha/beta fold hydrolase [Paraburkholderia sp. Ac-20342]
MIAAAFERLSRQARQQTAANGSLSYVDLGKGQPVVFVHGGHGGWYHWIVNIEALAQGRRVIAPDLPGFGASSAPAETFSLEVAGQRVFDLLDELDVGQFDLVAFSFGSCVAGYMAASRPERIRTLTLVNPAGMGPVSASLSQIQKEAAEVARSVGMEGGVEVSLKKIMLSDPSLVTPELTALAARHVRATRVLTRPIARSNPTRALIERVQAPVWLVLGSKDPHQAHEVAAREGWIHSLSARNRASVQAAAHWLQYERAEWFNRHLSEFIS